MILHSIGYLFWTMIASMIQIIGLIHYYVWYIVLAVVVGCLVVLIERPDWIVGGF